MTTWDKLKELYRQPPVGMTRQVILKRVWAEGDLNLKEKRSLLIYAKMLREENARLEKHNVFLLNEIDNYSESLINKIQKLEALEKGITQLFKTGSISPWVYSCLMDLFPEKEVLA